MRIKHSPRTSASTSLHENLGNQQAHSPNRTAHTLGANLLLDLSASRQSTQAACALQYQPFVSLIDKIQCSENVEGFHFRYEPIKGKHFVYATLDENNELSFGIRAEGDRSTFGSGTDMFTALMSKIEQSGLSIHKVKADWQRDTTSINAEAFQANKAKGFGLSQAAKQTWTGRRLAQYGFHPYTIQENGHSCSVIFKKRDV